MIHGESPRLNPALTRCSQVTHYFFEGCAYHAPALYDDVEAKPHILEPFDIGGRRFVKSNQDLVLGRPDLVQRLPRQSAIWRAMFLRKLAIE